MSDTSQSSVEEPDQRADRPRVLMLTEFFPASDAVEVTGGVEARCYYVAKAAEHDGDIRVMALRSTGDRWRPPSLASIPRRLWFVTKLFVASMREKFDVIEGTNLVVHPVAWMVGKLKRRRVVFWYPDVLIGHWRGQHFGWAGRIGEFVERMTLKLPVDRYIVITNAVADRLAAHGVPRSKISVVPCGFPAEGVAEAAADPERFDRPTIVVANRLVPYKNTPLVVRALGSVKAQIPDVQLVIIGRGPDEEPVRSLARQLGVEDRVIVRGHVERHVDVLRAIAGASVFVSASEIEGFGIVVLEAMAVGVPYVATDIGAFAEITDGGVGGSLVPVGDADGLAKAIVEVLADPVRAQAHADAGRELSQGRTWTAVADHTRSIFRDVVTRR